MTQQAESVTDQRDTPRARTPSSGGSVTVSRVTTQRDVTGSERDSDIRPVGSRHHHETGRKAGKEKTSWMHLAAMNLVHDHEAGLKVDASKLELAKRLLGMPYAPARISPEQA